MASEKTRVVADDQNTDSAMSAGLQTFASSSPPVISGAVDNAGDIQNPLSAGSVTDDRQPGFHGLGTPGDTIIVKDNGIVIGQTDVAADGTWTCTPSTDLLEGLHAITVVARAPSGTESAPSAPFNFEIDVTPPDASKLFITGAMDDVGSVTGNVMSGATTDDTRPLLSGASSGVPGHTVTVMVKDATGMRELGQAVVGANGNWTFQVDMPLAAGLNTFSLVARDTAGNETMPTGRYKITVDTDTPTAPVIESVEDDVGTVQMLQKGDVTDDARPTFIGSAQAGHTVKLYDGSTLLGQVVADAHGKWEFTPTAALADGTHDITATATSPLGQTSDASDAWNFEVDTVPPAAPTLVTVVDDVGSITANVTDGGLTDDAKPDFKGKAEANSTVKVYDGSTLLGTAVANASGDWTFTPGTALGDGVHSITVTATDAAGNVSAASAAFGFTVDTVAPTQTATVSAMGKDSGFSGTDYLTNDGSAGRLMQGNLSAALGNGETLQVSTDGGQTWGTAVVEGTSWLATDFHAHTADWLIQTRVVDDAGNSGDVKSQQVLLDTQAPNAPTEVIVSGQNVTVKLADTGLKVGDMLDIVSNGKHLQYTLTQADIDAQSVTGTVPADMARDVVVGVFDQAGNVSDYRTTPSRGSETLDFNTALVKRVTSTGTYINNSSVKLSNNTPFKEWKFFPELGNWGIWLGNPSAPHKRTDFMLDESASQVQFEFHDESSMAPMYVAFFDAAGVEIGRLNYLGTSIDHDGFVDFTAPAGKKIASFSYVTPGVAGGGDSGGTIIDNLVIIRAPAGGGQLLPPEQVQNLSTDSQVHHGSDGDNLFQVANPTSLSAPGAGIQGGKGIDTLQLTGANALLDMTQLTEKIDSIEVFDITGSGDNTLKLSVWDVMNNGMVDGFVDNGRVQVLVKGNAGDKVTLTDLLPNGVDAGDWVKKANVTVSGVVYEVYQHSGFGAELLVQQGVAVTLQNTAATFSSTGLEVDADAAYGTDVLAHATQAFTENDDTLIARLGFADRLAGGAGNDTITNVGTADVAHGGLGDDVIRINSGDFERVEGGLGIDTLVMDGKAMHIDLSALGMKVQGFEKFDLGAGGNTLALHASDVLAGGVRDMVTADGKVQMLVNGANGDVNLLGGDDGWTQGNSTSVSGVTYSVYTNLAGTAELLVEDKVHVTIM